MQFLIITKRILYVSLTKWHCWRSGSVPWNGISSWVRKPCVRLQTKDGWKFYETDVAM